VDVELTELVLYGTHDPSRSAYMRVPFPDLEERIGEPTPVIGRGTRAWTAIAIRIVRGSVVRRCDFSWAASAVPWMMFQTCREMVSPRPVRS